MPAYVFLLMFQQERDNFANLWNSYSLRSQNSLELQNSLPGHMFPFFQNSTGWWSTKGYSSHNRVVAGSIR